MKVLHWSGAFGSQPDKLWTFDHSPEVLDDGACFFLLQSRELGRIAFNVKGQPEIFPINYAMEGRIVVFRTGPGTKLDVVPSTLVAFEVDSWEPDLGTGWSVVVKGRAEEVTANPGRTAEHLRRARVHPVAPGDRWHWLAISPSEVTGRRFQVRPHKNQERA
jgi:nitroimidazol reductase NimA-like FMN-containing flavoprotein (pyridoxamine 5'-phosphate oxidase superfamily)